MEGRLHVNFNSMLPTHELINRPEWDGQLGMFTEINCDCNQYVNPTKCLFYRVFDSIPVTAFYFDRQSQIYRWHIEIQLMAIVRTSSQSCNQDYKPVHQVICICAYSLYVPEFSNLVCNCHIAFGPGAPRFVKKSKTLPMRKYAKLISTVPTLVIQRECSCRLDLYVYIFQAIEK